MWVIFELVCHENRGRVIDGLRWVAMEHRQKKECDVLDTEGGELFKKEEVNV